MKSTPYDGEKELRKHLEKVDTLNLVMLVKSVKEMAALDSKFITEWDMTWGQVAEIMLETLDDRGFHR